MATYHSIEGKSLKDATQSACNAKMIDTIKQTLDMALEAGIQGADIILAEGQQHRLKAHQGKIAENKLSSSRIMGIRVQKEGRIGLSYSESLEETDRRRMLDMALNNAQFAKKDESQGIHIQADNPYFPDCSAQYSDELISLEQKEALTLKLESEPLARDKRVLVVPENGLSESRSERYIANTAGVLCYDRRHSFSCYTYILMGENGHKADFGEGSQAFHFADLELERCITTALNEASFQLNAKSLASGSYDVIFTPDALASLFGSFSIIFSGLAAKKKTNPMREKLGAQIASSALTIYDLPRYSKSLYTQFFDAEGAIPQDLTLLQDGVLSNFYHNSETAKYFATNSNARAARSPGGSLGTGGNVILIQPADSTTSNVRVGRWIEVIELNGLHSGCDPISGDFSLSCTGKLFQDGELIQGVKDITLAGNFYQMLNQISAVGPELKSTSDKDFFCPDLRFSGLSIAGDST